MIMVQFREDHSGLYIYIRNALERSNIVIRLVQVRNNTVLPCGNDGKRKKMHKIHINILTILF